MIREIRECLLNIRDKYTVLNARSLQCFHLKLGGQYFSIPYPEIIFFETSHNLHRVILHGEKKIMEFPGQLSTIEKQLDDHFFRCHRSCLINLDNVEAVDLHCLTVMMKNKEVCPISTRQKRKFRTLILQK